MNQLYAFMMAVLVILALLFSRRGLEEQARRRVLAVYGELSVDDPAGGRDVVIQRYRAILRGAIIGMQVGAFLGAVWAGFAGRHAPFSGMVAVIAGLWLGGEVLKTSRMRGPVGEAHDVDRYLPRLQRATIPAAWVLLVVPLLVLAVTAGTPGALWTGIVGAVLVVVLMMLLWRMLSGLLHTEPGWTPRWDELFRAEAVRTWAAMAIVGPTMMAFVVFARIAELSMARPAWVSTTMTVVGVVWALLIMLGLFSPIGAHIHHDDLLESEQSQA